MYALANLQEKSGDPRFTDIWRAWFQPQDHLNVSKYSLIPAAFSGLAMSQRHVPGDELQKLLGFRAEAHEQGCDLKISPAVLALWVDRESDSINVIQEIWNAIQQTDTPEENWEIIRECADRTWPEVESFEEAQAEFRCAGDDRTTDTVCSIESDQGETSPWGLEITIRPQFRQPAHAH